MLDESEYTVITVCDPLPERASRKGASKYPFHLLDAPGRGLDIRDRAEVTVRQALKRWAKSHAVSWRFTVRKLGAAVRVRRDQ